MIYQFTSVDICQEEREKNIFSAHILRLMRIFLFFFKL